MTNVNDIVTFVLIDAVHYTAPVHNECDSLYCYSELLIGFLL